MKPIISVLLSVLPVFANAGDLVVGQNVIICDAPSNVPSTTFK
jgi:hypothetical protein